MNYFLLGACLLILLAGCKQDTIIPTATTSTGTSTGASSQAITLASGDWTFWVSNWVSNGVSNGSQDNPNQYQPSVTTSVSGTTSTSIGGIPVMARSESYSLGVSALTIKDTVSYSYWTAALAPPKTLIPGKSLTLKAKVQLQNVQGKGISLALRGGRTAQSAVLFATTQGKTNITGTSDFTEYSVTLPYSTSVDYILIYLVHLPKTTGKAIFRDVSLQVN